MVPKYRDMLQRSNIGTVKQSFKLKLSSEIKCIWKGNHVINRILNSVLIYDFSVINELVSPNSKWICFSISERPKTSKTASVLKWIETK